MTRQLPRDFHTAAEIHRATATARFERNGEWWMVIGAQREDLTGAVVVYTSRIAAVDLPAASWAIGQDPQGHLPCTVPLPAEHAMS